MRTLRNSLIAVGSLCLIFILLQSASAATTEEVIEKIKKSQAEMQSIEFDLKTVVKSPTLEPESTSHLAEEFVTKGGGAVVHHMYSKGGGKILRSLTVDDGEFVWWELTSPGSRVVSVSKYPSRKVRVSKGRTTWPWSEAVDTINETIREFDLKVTGEDTLDGEQVWVLEGPAKAVPTDDDMGKVRMLVSQNDCMARRVLIYDKDGKERMNTQFTNVKVNQPIDPALFKYTPPEGAKVQDRT